MLEQVHSLKSVSDGVPFKTVAGIELLPPKRVSQKTCIQILRKTQRKPSVQEFFCVHIKSCKYM